VDVSPSFVGYGGFLFLWLRQMVLLSFVQVGGVAGFFLCRRRSDFGRFFIVFYQMFEARSTLVRRFLLDTRPLAEFSVAVRPCCRSHRSPEFGSWPARARGVSALWRA